MCADTNSTGEVKAPVRRKFRVLKWVSVVIVVLLLVVFFGVPAFLSSSAGTGFVVNKVNKSLDGEIGMGDLNVGWFKGVHLKEFSFADDKGMTKVSVKEITAKPSYASMLSGNISLGKVVVDRPEVSVRLEEREASDKSVKGAKVEKSQKGGGPKVFFNQIDLTIKDGDVKILPASGEVDGTIHFSNIASKVDLKAGKSASFDVGMDVENNGRRSKISADGNVESSKKGWSLKGTEGQMKVKVDDLDLSSLSPVLALLGKDIVVGGELNADAEIKFGDGQVEKLVVDARLDKFKHVAGEKVIALKEPITLNGRVSTSNDKVNIEDINLRSSFCTITGKGAGNELDYTADMDIGKTMDFVGTFVDLKGYSFSGTAREEGRVTFEDDTIRFSDHSSVENYVMVKTDETGTKRMPGLSAKFTFDMTVDVKNGKTKVDYLTMKTTDSLADLRIEDSVFSWARDSDEKMDMKLIGTVDLAKVEPYGLFLGVMQEKMDLAGKLNTETVVKNRGSEYIVVTDKTTVRGLKIATEGVKEKFEDEKVDVKLDMIADIEGKSIFLKKFVVDGTKVDVDFGYKRGITKDGRAKVSGQVTARYDLKDVSAVASAYLPEGIEVEGRRSDTFRFESLYPAGDKDKMLANMNASGKLGFERAKYKGMNIGKVDLDVDVKNGMANIAPFSSSVNKGKLNFAGNIDLTKKPMVLSIPKPTQIIDKVEVNAEIGSKLLKFLAPLFDDQSNLSGIGSLYCNKLVIPLGGEAAIANAQIDGAVSLSNMKLQNSGFLGLILSKGGMKPLATSEMLKTKFALAKGILSYDDLQVNVDKVYPINFAGGVNLNKKPAKYENMYVELPFTNRLETVKVGQTGKKRLKLEVTGTVEEPKVEFEDLIKGVLEGEIGRLRDKYLRGDKDKKVDDGKKEADDGEKSDEEKIIEDVESIIDLFKKRKK